MYEVWMNAFVPFFIKYVTNMPLICKEKCLIINTKIRSPGLPAEQVLIFLLMLTLTTKLINESAEAWFKNL